MGWCWCNIGLWDKSIKAYNSDSMSAKTYFDNINLQPVRAKNSNSLHSFGNLIFSRLYKQHSRVRVHLIKVLHLSDQIWKCYQINIMPFENLELPSDLRYKQMCGVQLWWNWNSKPVVCCHNVIQIKIWMGWREWRIILGLSPGVSRIDCIYCYLNYKN